MNDLKNDERMRRVIVLDDIAVEIAEIVSALPMQHRLILLGSATMAAAATNSLGMSLPQTQPAKRQAAQVI